SVDMGVLQASVGVGLDEQGGHSVQGSLPCPLVVGVGEVVIDPHQGYVSRPGGDSIAFPQVAVGVAGELFGGTEVNVRVNVETKPGADEPCGRALPTGGPSRADQTSGVKFVDPCTVIRVEPDRHVDAVEIDPVGLVVGWERTCGPGKGVEDP